ncbi:hypothetical protein PCANC_25820 [Puccinia coronata f. sp. avenae]|uniref:Uncharacterized protein n=1 Tax=Puccinia coronata f. sp. avenae TaxID=200324 RepID=A0A2N5TZZ0_9BASI|nr:hypothetical protein PCANC_25820 [Puccinia coronata f. sp. avenae]
MKPRQLWTLCAASHLKNLSMRYIVHRASLKDWCRRSQSWLCGFTCSGKMQPSLPPAAQAVLKQPCSTGGRTETVRPKQEPTGWTDLSDRSRLVLCNRSQELIGQACPTRRQVLWSDSACPTTGQTRLFKHRSNCRVRPVNAGSAWSSGVSNEKCMPDLW